jgi:hypothetical protein
MVNNAVHPETPNTITEEYIKILAEFPSENHFLEKIIGYFVFSELGF